MVILVTQSLNQLGLTCWEVQQSVAALHPLSYSPELVTGCVRGIRLNLENGSGNILNDTIPKRNQLIRVV